MGDRTYSFDINAVLSDGATAQTADGFMQNAAADGIMDLGGRQSTTPAQQARIDAMLVIDVTAIDIASGDERYRFKLLGCNSSAFASGVTELCSIELGKGSAGVPTTQGDSVVGRYEVGFTNEQANTKFEFIKLFMDVGGTTPSITAKAFVAVLPEG